MVIGVGVSPSGRPKKGSGPKKAQRVFFVFGGHEDAQVERRRAREKPLRRKNWPESRSKRFFWPRPTRRPKNIKSKTKKTGKTKRQKQKNTKKQKIGKGLSVRKLEF
jgi:hypothetical protein